MHTLDAIFSIDLANLSFHGEKTRLKSKTSARKLTAKLRNIIIPGISLHLIEFHNLRLKSLRKLEIPPSSIFLKIIIERCYSMVLQIMSHDIKLMLRKQSNKSSTI